MKKILLLLAMSVLSLGADAQDYDFTLFRRVCDSSRKDQNVFVSPFSARMVLSMTSSGAWGKTRRQILDALGFSGLDQEEVNILNGKMLDSYCSMDPSITFEMANGLWVPKQIKLKKKFKKKAVRYYDAGIGPLDIDAINEWCDLSTHHFIPKLMDELPQGTLLSLTNAIYMKAPWSTVFMKEATKKETFHTSSGKDQTVDMMHRQSKMKYCSVDEFEMVELPYGDGTFVMDVLLPKKDLDGCIASLDKESWNKALDAMSMQTVNLRLPRFETEFAADLSPQLKSMGMLDAFSSTADFSQMTKTQLMISMVFQRARVKVNEEGTEAAAVTAVMMTKTVRPQFILVVPFTVDRPFAFVIRETKSGTVFFTGRMNSIE